MRLRRHRRWPHGPRFTVGSVTGSLIQQTTRGGGHTNRPMPVLWYVHDAAYCYRIVHEGWDEQTARRLARRLNREEASR